MEENLVNKLGTRINRLIIAQRRDTSRQHTICLSSLQPLQLNNCDNMVTASGKFRMSKSKTPLNFVQNYNKVQINSNKHNSQNIVNNYPIKVNTKFTSKLKTKLSKIQPQSFHFQTNLKNSQPIQLNNGNKNHVLNIKKSKKNLKNQNNLQTYLQKMTLFKRCELKSFYNSLLQYSKGDYNKFKIGFKIFLNYTNIPIRQDIMNQSLNYLKQQINLKNFIITLNQIQIRILKKNIIDYFIILLEGKDHSHLTYDIIIDKISQRLSYSQAINITNKIFQELRKNHYDIINSSQIYSLCYQNQNFCRFINIQCAQNSK